MLHYYVLILAKNILFSKFNVVCPLKVSSPNFSIYLTSSSHSWYHILHNHFTLSFTVLLRMRGKEWQEEALGVKGGSVRSGKMRFKDIQKFEQCWFLGWKYCDLQKMMFLRQYQHIIIKLLSKTFFYAGVSL